MSAFGYYMKKTKLSLKKIVHILFWSDREICYINGADILPQALSPEEEQVLISAAGKDENKKAELIEHNLRLVVYIAKRFENTGTGIEELISIGTVGLMKAINTFCPEKNIKLATYASRCIENEILMFLRKNSVLKKEVSIDEPLNVDWDGNELLLSDILGSESDQISRHLEENEEKALVHRAVSHLSERERKIIELRFGLDGKQEMTQKEVANLLGISQSYISRLEKRIIASMKAEIVPFF